MLPRVFPLATLLATAFAKSSSQVKEGLYARNGVLVTDEDVERFELYSEYARSASCNVDKGPDDQVTCEVNCDNVIKDEAIIDETFYGPVSDVAAYVAVVEKREQIVVVFRPTISDENWTTNCNYTTIPSDVVEGGMVHGGFHYAWSEISVGITASVTKLHSIHPTFTIVTVGHSLGGALASVAAADLIALGPPVEIYTYGAPRVGNDELSSFISATTTVSRVTNNWDPIPLVPLAEGPVFGGQYEYRHVSPEYWLTGQPEDEVHWPAEDIKVCEGGLNMDCNSGIPWINFTQHSLYFGPMNCKRWTWGQASNGVYIPDYVEDEITKIFSGDISVYSGIGDCFQPKPKP
ncbi:unnamed protein product [Clonostachys rhizophaga]|uniref:Fungal lipase-type domain-containing protein n=1 Tax=Clonostachys rhizophaga TaxID=160324 RepID=A0A9N9VY09_9HYPO|nr:unnamed protein product [Clonostachys rhizophaga]